MSVVSDVEIRLRADIARLRQDLQEARREVTGALNSMSAAAEAFKGVLGGIAAGLSVGAFASFIKNSIDAADALNDMSVRTKVAIEDLAGLAYAAKLGDTSLEGVASSITKLGQNIGKDGAKFRALGITATEPLEAFKQLADVFKNIQDPQTRAAFGAEALGKSWQEAAVLLDGGSDGISKLIDRGKELSGITEQVAADAGAFNDKLDELGFAAQGVGTRIAAGLLPTLQKIADSFSANSVNGKELEGTITVLSAALKALYSVGVGVSALFVGLGKSIGGTAAVAVAALSGDFSGALATYKAMAADVYTGLGDAAIQIGKLWVDTGKSAVQAADDTAKAAGDSTAKVAAFLNSGEIAAARKKAAADAQAAIDKEKKAYAGLIASIKEKMAADQLEINGAAAITPVQQARIKLDEELRTGKVALTEEHVKEAHALLDAARAMEKNAAAAKQVRAAVAALADERDKNYQSLVDEATANEELVRAYGKTKLEIAQMTLARDQDRLSQRGALELSEDTVAQLEREIDARKRSIAAMGSLDVLEKQKKATDEAADAQKAFWKSIDDTAHATFVSIANGSKDTAQRLKDTFKNVFFDWLYQQTIKKWIINIGTSTSSTGGVASGIASLFDSGSSGGGNSAGGILGTASNWLSIGKTIYSGFTGGLVSTLGSSITSLGTMLGSEAVAAFGAGLSGGALGATTASAASGYAGTAAASAGAGAAGAIPVIGWIITAMMTANGLYKQGWDATNGTLSETGKILGSGILALNSTLKKFGMSDSLANIFSGQATISKLFGRKNPEIESQGLRGTLTATGTTDAQNYINILQKGGWFRSDKRTSQTAAASSETDKLFDTTMTAMSTAVKAFGQAMGLETKAIDSYTKSFDLKLTGKAETDNAAVAKLFGDVGDELSLRLVPGLAAFAKEGETMSATLQRLAVDYQTVDAILTATGQSIKVFGVAGIEVRENLIAAAGGLEQLSSGVNYFQQNFLSSAQQLAPVQKQVADALAAMGMSAVKTNDQFAAATLGIDLNTKAGADLYVRMLALAPAFKAVADATAQMEAAAKAQADAAIAAAQASAAAEMERLKAVADALAATNKGYDDQIDALLAARAGAAAVREFEIRGLDATTVARYDYLKALQAEDAAAQQAADAARAAAAADAERLRTNETLLKGGVSSMLDAVTNAVAARKTQLKSAFDDVMAGFADSIAKWSSKITDLRSLSDLLSGARVGATQNAASRASAQAQLEATFAIAKASGVLPSADSIRDAISAVSADSADQFGTLIEYQRDQARASRSISGLAGLTDDQLTTAEKTLQVLQNQKAAADAAYPRQIGALDSLLQSSQNAAGIALGTYQATMSVDAGVASLAAAIAALKLGATPGNPGGAGMTVEDLYRSVLGREGDAAGVAFWKSVFGASVDAGESAQFIQGAADELASKANGTWAQWLASHGAGGTAPTGTTALQTSLDALNTQMAGMQASMDRTAMSTTKLADQFDQVSSGGNALFTESA